MSKVASNLQPLSDDFTTDAVMRIFAHLEDLIIAADKAQDKDLSNSLKQSLATSLECYCDTQRAILEAKIKASLKSAA